MPPVQLHPGAALISDKMICLREFLDPPSSSKNGFNYPIVLFFWDICQLSKVFRGSTGVFTLEPRSWLRCRVWAVWWRLLRHKRSWCQFGCPVWRWQITTTTTTTTLTISLKGPEFAWPLANSSGASSGGGLASEGAINKLTESLFTKWFRQDFAAKEKIAELFLLF